MTNTNIKIYDASQKFADLFNFQSKLIDRYSVPYFCSKFLVITENWMYVIPDILKLLTKFGRRDMSNWQHVEEYRVSCLDATVSLLNRELVTGLGIRVKERYKGDIIDLEKVLRIVNRLVTCPEAFKSLFIYEKGMILHNDPTRSSL